MRHNPIVLVTWGLLALAYLEFLLAKKRDLTVYSSSQTLATIGLGIGHLFVGLTVIESLLRYIDSSIPNKLFTLPPGLIWGVCAFLVLDFLKYIAHRLAHQVGFFCARADSFVSCGAAGCYGTGCGAWRWWWPGSFCHGA